MKVDILKQAERTESDKELCRELDGANEGLETWERLKMDGSAHYKTGTVEPVDLYRAAGAFKPWALCSIIKYAFRNLRGCTVSETDMDKIIDLARKVKAA